MTCSRHCIKYEMDWTQTLSLGFYCCVYILWKAGHDNSDYTSWKSQEKLPKSVFPLPLHSLSLLCTIFPEHHPRYTWWLMWEKNFEGSHSLYSLDYFSVLNFLMDSDVTPTVVNWSCQGTRKITLCSFN